MRMRKNNMSMPGGIGLGIGFALAITVIGAVVISYLLMSEWMDFSAIGYGAMAIFVASSFVGCLVAAGRVGHRRLMVCAICAGGYFAMLMVIGLAFGGMRQGVLPTLICICLGGGIVAVGPMLGKASGGRKVHFKTFR